MVMNRNFFFGTNATNSYITYAQPTKYTVDMAITRNGISELLKPTVGENYNLDVENITDITITFYPLNGVTITGGFRTNTTRPIGISPPPDNYARFVMEKAQWDFEANDSSRRFAIITTGEVVANPDPEPVEPHNAKKVLFYNNDVSKLWDGVKNAIVKLSLWGEFNFATQEYPNKTYDIILGEYNFLDWNTISDWNSINAAYINIIAVDPIKISKFRNDYLNIENFETPRQEIDYKLNSQEITELSNNGLTFLLQTKESEPPPIEKDAISNQYYLTDDEFKTFKEEYLNILAGQTALEENPKVSDFLSSVKLLPFKIPEINKGDSQTPIKIQNGALNSKGTILVSDIISLNLGIISVPKMYNNSLDFKNVTIDLYLPFVNSSISIDPFYIIGNSVEIICNIVIETGDMTINLVNTLTNDIYNISNSTIGLDYPFFQTKSGDNLFSPKQAINSIRQAYVIVNTPEYSKSNPKSEIKGSLINEKGLINIKEVEVNINTTSIEKDMILTALNNGVIIK